MKYLAIIQETYNEVGPIFVYGPASKSEIILEMSSIKDIKAYKVALYQVVDENIDAEILTVLGERRSQPNNMFVWNRRK